MRHHFHSQTQEVIVDFKLPSGQVVDVRGDYCPVCGRVILLPGDLVKFHTELERHLEERIRQAKESEAVDHESTER